MMEITVVANAIITRIEKMFLSMMPICSPMEATISSTAPRLFMARPMARDSMGFILKKLVMIQLPNIFPKIATPEIANTKSGTV